MKLPGISPDQQQQVDAIEAASTTGAPSPVSRQAIQQIIDDCVDSVHAQGGWAGNRATLYSNFLNTPAGKLLGQYSLRHDTPDAKPQAPVERVSAKKADILFNGAIAPKAEAIAKAAKVSTAEATAALLSAKPELYEAYLKAQDADNEAVAKATIPETPRVELSEREREDIRKKVQERIELKNAVRHSRK